MTKLLKRLIAYFNKPWGPMGQSNDDEVLFKNELSGIDNTTPISPCDVSEVTIEELIEHLKGKENE